MLITTTLRRVEYPNNEHEYLFSTHEKAEPYIAPNSPRYLDDNETVRVLDPSFYKKWLEEDENNRRKDLNPDFYKEIHEFIYCGGTIPCRIDCWDAPIEWLKKHGVLEIVLKEELWEK